MFVSHDYQCDNEDCERYRHYHERFVRKSEQDDQRCGVCGITLTRLPSAPGSTFSFAGRSAKGGRRK